jgi:hypothetical protein
VCASWCLLSYLNSLLMMKVKEEGKSIGKMRSEIQNASPIIYCNDCTAQDILSRVSTCFEVFRLYSVKLSGKIGEIRRRPNTQPNRVRGSCACGRLSRLVSQRTEE